MAQHIRIIVGSLRRDSINRKLAEAVVAHGHPELSFAFSEVGDLPLYNQDIEDPSPAAVERLRAEILSASGVLIVTPEYNRSIPAALKNAIDWVSRPHAKNAWAHKPGAIMGSSPGSIATALGQQHVRATLSCLGFAMMPRPEFYLQWRDDALEDAVTTKRIGVFLEAFADWVKRNAAAKP
jgi:chromate reductase, NAD(P)H dehydrogenase (quinone)